MLNIILIGVNNFNGMHILKCKLFYPLFNKIAKICHA